MSAPRKRIAPRSGRASPPMRLNSVVLPAPLGPMMPSSTPASIESVTPATARTAPNDFSTRSSVSSGIGGPGARRSEGGSIDAAALRPPASRGAEQPQLAAGRDHRRGAVVDHDQLVLVLLAA